MEEFLVVAKAEGLKTFVLEDNMDDESIIGQATKASLLVVPFDGTARDALRHFVTGSVVARPRAGQAAAKLDRKVLAVVVGGTNPAELLADALRRCPETVEVVSPENVRSKAKAYAGRHRQWAHSRGTA
jgi:hypothetical protein